MLEVYNTQNVPEFVQTSIIAVRTGWGVWKVLCRTAVCATQCIPGKPPKVVQMDMDSRTSRLRL